MTNPSPRVQDLFAYGSLMCQDIMDAVVGSALTSTPARLHGFRRYAMRDELYPGVIASVSGSVEGKVYHRVSLKHWERLDRFEGEMYDRKPVTVQYEDGTQALAYCYLIRAEYLHRLSTAEWNYAVFLREGKQAFKRQYCGFANLAGRAGQP